MDIKASRLLAGAIIIASACYLLANLHRASPAGTAGLVVIYNTITGAAAWCAYGMGCSTR
jgi:hypothetical protein